MSHDILLSLIDPDPEQPRKHFDEAGISDLAQSIEANGLAVPILVRPVGDRFVIVHGERRYRAVKSLGWPSIPAEVREIDADTAQWLALAENVQRADLSPIEEAEAFKARLSTGMTQAQLGARIGKTQSYIAQKLRLLTLPEPVAYYLNIGAITEGHTRQLLRLRAIYGEQTITLDPEGFESLGDSQIEDMAFAIIMRPWSRMGATADHDDKPEIHAQAIRVFSDYLKEHAGTIEAWSLAGTWFAREAAAGKVSVTDLKTIIDFWIETMYSAAVYLWEKQKPASNDLLDSILYWGYKADLKHARLSLTEDLHLQALSWIVEANYQRPPSEMSQNYPELCTAWCAGQEMAALHKEVQKLQERFDRAKTLQDFAQIATDAGEKYQKAAELRLRADRKAGQLLNEIENMSRDIVV